VLNISAGDASWLVAIAADRGEFSREPRKKAPDRVLLGIACYGQYTVLLKPTTSQSKFDSVDLVQRRGYEGSFETWEGIPPTR